MINITKAIWLLSITESIEIFITNITDRYPARDEICRTSLKTEKIKDDL
jgi:hypothetical protein